MKKFGKNKILATLLLSAYAIGTENIETKAFSQKYLPNVNKFNKDIFLDDYQLEEIHNIRLEEEFINYISISGNIGKPYREIILLTLAGIRNENKEEWKIILHALQKTKKKLIIRFSDDFEKPNQTACSTTLFKYPVIKFNRQYFMPNGKPANISQLQPTMCHEIGHIYIEALRIKNNETEIWRFDDRYIEDLISPSKRTTEALLFIDEYKKYKNAYRRGNLQGRRKPIPTNAGVLLSMYGLRSHDDTEALADIMKDYLIKNSKEPAILNNLRLKCTISLASYGAQIEPLYTKRRPYNNSLKKTKIKRIQTNTALLKTYRNG